MNTIIGWAFVVFGVCLFVLPVLRLALHIWRWRSMNWIKKWERGNVCLFYFSIFPMLGASMINFASPFIGLEVEGFLSKVIGYGLPVLVVFLISTFVRLICLALTKKRR